MKKSSQEEEGDTQPIDTVEFHCDSATEVLASKNPGVLVIMNEEDEEDDEVIITKTVLPHEQTGEEMYNPHLVKLERLVTEDIRNIEMETDVEKTNLETDVSKDSSQSLIIIIDDDDDDDEDIVATDEDINHLAGEQGIEVCDISKVKVEAVEDSLGSTIPPEVIAFINDNAAISEPAVLEAAITPQEIVEEVDGTLQESADKVMAEMAADKDWFNEGVDFSVPSDSVKLELGINNLFFTYMDNKFCIGQYFQKNGKGVLVRGERGVELDISVVFELLKNKNALNLELEKMRKGERVDRKVDLGMGWYLSVSSPYTVVHIRKWESNNYRDYPTIATGNGIALKFHEFRKFQDCADQMKDFVPCLFYFVPCYDSHDDIFPKIYCKFCNPYAVFVKTRYPGSQTNQD